MYYKQKNITISQEQVEFIKNNKGKMSISMLSKMLGLTMNKVHNNMKVLKLHKPRTKVVKMNKRFFNEQEFFKKYKY